MPRRASSSAAGASLGATTSGHRTTPRVVDAEPTSSQFTTAYKFSPTTVMKQPPPLRHVDLLTHCSVSKLTCRWATWALTEHCCVARCSSYLKQASTVHQLPWLYMSATLNNPLASTQISASNDRTTNQGFDALTPRPPSFPLPSHIRALQSCSWRVGAEEMNESNLLSLSLSLYPAPWCNMGQQIAAT
jgi:hypothetical protein